MDNNISLAINGGKPVRTKPFVSRYLGTSIYGAEEMALLQEVVEKKLPFRGYGDGTPHMVNDFEALAKEYFGVRYALAVATGSGSFYCAMVGLGVGPGDEVILPAFSWYTDFEAVALMGATPVFAEIDRSLNLDPDDVAKKITGKTKAVITVHFQGASNNLDRLLEIARPRAIRILEDCAQACGAGYKGRKLGSIGDVACFSFQQNKIISTGDGGLLLTNDARIFERAVRFHDLGFMRDALKAQLPAEPQEPPFVSCQFRMSEFTGAVALAQLRKLDSRILNITRAHYQYLRRRIAAECPGLKPRLVGDPEGDAGIAFYMDLETPEQGGWFGKALRSEGVPIGPSSNCCNLLTVGMVQKPLMAHAALPPFGKGWPAEHIVYTPDLCPKTREIIPCLVCVAQSPHDTDDDVKDMAEAIIKVWNLRPETGRKCRKNYDAK